MMGVVDTGTPVALRRSIPRVTARSPKTAREWTRTQLTGLVDDLDLAELAVSELLTNVARYAAGSALIALALTDDGLEVACFDRHPETAANVLVAGIDDENGRGLFILAAVAIDGVHVDTDPRRKRVAVRLPIGAV